MKTTLIVLGIVLAIILVPTGLFVGKYVSSANAGNAIEKRIIYAHENNQQILSSYFLKVKEMAQVPKMYEEQLKSVYQGALSSRYGEEGSQAMFQWIQEQNPNFDASMLIKLQQVMEAGRNEFKHTQTALIDIRREYDTQLGYVVQGFFLKLAGYPKINLDDYKAVQSAGATKVFESGVDEAVQL